jgi:hypothetical protein
MRKSKPGNKKAAKRTAPSKRTVKRIFDHVIAPTIIEVVLSRESIGATEDGLSIQCAKDESIKE